MAYTTTISGKAIGLTIDGSAVVSSGGTTQWRASGRADELDASVGEDGAFSDVDTGKRTLELTATILLDIAEGTTIAEGDEIENVRCYYDVVTPGLVAVTIPLMKVLSVERGGEVKGRVEFSFTAKNRGSYTYAG